MDCKLADKLRHKPAVTVDISAIDLNDRTYEISSGGNKEALTNSLQFAGLLHPVWLAPKGSHYLIVSGFARVRFGLEQGWETIAAMVLSDDFSELELAQLAVLDNLSNRTLNPLEEARAINILRHFGPMENGTSPGEQIARRLGLFRTNTNYILQMPPITQNAIAEGQVSLSVLHDLALFADDEIVARFTDIFVKGKVGLNRQREFIRLVYELGRIQSIDAGSVFELPEFKAIWQNAAESDQRKKAIILLDWLYRQRYPYISAVREQARQKIAVLGLDNRIRLNMPENFENLRHSLSFSFESRDELLEILNLCLKMADNPDLNDLFKREEV